MLPNPVGVELATSWSPVGRASNWATEAGACLCTVSIDSNVMIRLTPVLLNPDMPTFPNCEDPDQSEVNWSGSALFVIKYVNLYQEYGSQSTSHAHMKREQIGNTLARTYVNKRPSKLPATTIPGKVIII